MSPWADRSIFAKLFTVLAFAFMSGVGLCGLDFLLASKGIGKSTQEFGVGPLDGVSLAVMSLSALALALTAVVWSVAGIFGAFEGGRKSNGPTKLFDDSDESKR
jgi:hypothetical protein